MVPALTLLFKLDIKKAVGISLVTIVPVALVGAVTYFILESSYVRIFVALLIIVGSVTGAKYGATIANKISSNILSKIFSVLLILIGLKLVGLFDIPIVSDSNSTIYPLLVVLGLIAGLGSAMFGIGGGVIMVPLLNLFFGLTIHEAIATSLTVIAIHVMSTKQKKKKIDALLVVFGAPEKPGARLCAEACRGARRRGIFSSLNRSNWDQGGKAPSKS